MNIENLKNIYLVGIGGIGMSALARYFRKKGLTVSGYDRMPTALTRQLQEEGINIVFADDEKGADPAADLVIYTPAVRNDHPIFHWYETNGYSIHKRSEVLQWITEGMRCIAIAGTHGKTTITTMIAHLLRQGEIGGYAFLGGISVNYETNFWRTGNTDVAVVEADEYDRSFLRLSPQIAVLTAMDADHLDIYGTEEALQQAFIDFTGKIKPAGTLWVKHGLKGGLKLKGDRRFTYALQNDAADAFAENITIEEGGYTFDWKNRSGLVLENMRLNIGGMHNVENAVVAIAVALEMGMDEVTVREALAAFKGVKRRFEYVLKTPEVIYIDDYAHHPKELEAVIQSAKRLFPGKKCTVAFQPHLYSRTRDLAGGFAESLSLPDEVILLDIYPARELPMPGVSAEMIKKKMNDAVPCTVLSKEGLLDFVEKAPLELFITAGAGDIDQLVGPIKKRLLEK
ncbi:MAG TPA: UDP-N-acetylmuramate--L-alanine ligase [Edaphocola sp.]|nr:UDP-N-acetylmuramate--L-alanine ligase [Edaphocola sp.]